MIKGTFTRDSDSPTWEGRSGWISRIDRRALEIKLGPKTERVASIALCGIFALGSEQAVPLGTAGAVIHFKGPGDRVVETFTLVSGRHFGDALDGAAFDRPTGDGSRLRSIHCCATERGRARIDRLEIDLAEPTVLSGLEFRVLGPDHDFVLYDAEFVPAVAEAVCPFRGRGGTIALSELASIVRLRNWERLDRAIQQLEAGILESAEVDAAKGAALTFLAVLSSALLELGVERKLHRFQLDAGRKLDALEIKQDIVAATRELCGFLLTDVLPAERSPSQAAIEKAIRMVEASFARELNDHQIAERIGMSTSHFRHLFKERTGEPFHKYILNLRLERARQEILASDLSIQEIAVEMGFASPAHFSRAFSQRFGCSPSSLRLTANID